MASLEGRLTPKIGDLLDEMANLDSRRTLVAPIRPDRTRKKSVVSETDVTVALQQLVETKTKEIEEGNSRLKAAYKALSFAESELQQAQKLESIGRLAAGVAHEINTPVQFVGDSIHFIKEGVTDLFGLVQELIKLTEGDLIPHASKLPIHDKVEDLKADFDLQYLLDHMIMAIDRSSEGLARVAEIVQSMKTFSYPDRKTMEAVDLNKSLKTTLSVAKNEYKYVANIITEFGEIPKIEAMSGEMNQVFLNLIINAAHAIEEVNSCSGRLGIITIRTRSKGKFVYVEIADTGAGIPIHIQDRIFDVFLTTKESGKGTGQGLAIARQVIEQKHSGSLSFTTLEGQGTTFTVKLPITQPEEANGSPASA